MTVRRGRRRRSFGSLVRASVFAASFLGLCSILVGTPSATAPTDAGTLVPQGRSTAPDERTEPDRAASGIGVPTSSASLADLGRRARPVVVTIPSLGVIARIGAAGVERDTGQLAIPPDAASVVWYRHGPSPGQSGSAVLAGHVDWNGSRGAFFSLGTLAPGAEISVTYDDGTTRRFVVQARRHHPKPDLPLAEIFAAGGAPRLTLITCGGVFDRAARHYRDNVVVVATPVT